MRNQVWLGFALIIATPFLVIICYKAGLIVNVVSVTEGIIATITATMIIGGISLIWKGRKPNDQRKKEIWYAIKEWVESQTQVGFGVNRGPRDFLLKTEAPHLAAEIDACLVKHYATVWSTLQEFRAKYSMSTRSVTSNGIAIDTIGGLTGLNARLITELKSEILDKHYTRLKC
jgi:hypothetical protein